MRSVKVTEYMAKNLTTFTPETKVFDALEVLLRKHYSGAPVVNANGDLVGVLSEADLMRVAIQGSYHEDTSGSGGQRWQARWHDQPARCPTGRQRSCRPKPGLGTLQTCQLLNETEYASTLSNSGRAPTCRSCSFTGSAVN